MGEAQAGPSNANKVSRNGLQVPSFSRHKPEHWFKQLEEQFTNANITEENKKFLLALDRLDNDILKLVPDILQKPPETGRYEKLKSELIKRILKIQKDQVLQLLDRQTMENRKPSQFLQHLKDMAGTVASPSLLRRCWMKKLPHNLRAILDEKTDMTLEDVAKLADRIQKILTDPSDADTSSPLAEMEFQYRERSTDQNHVHRRSRIRDRSPHGITSSCIDVTLKPELDIVTETTLQPGANDAEQP